MNHHNREGRYIVNQLPFERDII